MIVIGITKIIVAETIPYPAEWIIALTEMPNQKGEKLIEYDIRYGKYLGELVSEFMFATN